MRHSLKIDKKNICDYTVKENDTVVFRFASGRIYREMRNYPVLRGLVSFNHEIRIPTVDGSEIRNNHLGCI